MIFTRLGQVNANGGEALGYIKDIQAETSFSGARIKWSHSGINSFSDSNLLHAIYLNGQLIKVISAQAENQIELGLLEDGSNSFDVRIIEGERENVLEYLSDGYGPHSLIKWDYSTENDLRAYRVYRKTSGGSYSLIGTNTDIVVERVVFELPHSGSGSGRLSVDGAYNSTPTNKFITVQIQDSPRAFRHNLSGTYSAWVEFQKSNSYFLGDGISITFDSDPDDYDSSDEWYIHIGPSNVYVDKDFEENDYTYKIAAVDESGNESSFTDEIVNNVSRRPASVSSPSAVWDGTDIILSWTDPSPLGDVTSIEIYSNYNNNTQGLESHVIESSSMVSVGTGVESYTLSSPVSGEYKFYIRTKNSDGLVSDDINLLSVDTTSTPTSLDIEDAENLILTPYAGGGVDIEFTYNFNNGPDANKAYILVGKTESDLNNALSALASRQFTVYSDRVRYSSRYVSYSDTNYGPSADVGDLSLVTFFSPQSKIREWNGTTFANLETLSDDEYVFAEDYETQGGTLFRTDSTQSPNPPSSTIISACDLIEVDLSSSSVGVVNFSYLADKDYTSIFGVNTVYVGVFITGADNQYQSTVVADSVTIDSTAPADTTGTEVFSV